jgi:RNA polymerase sigma-70 factor, ECF subfamily
MRVQQGCMTSFEVLVDRLGPRLLRFLHRKTGNRQDAEDLVQETFMRVHRYIHRYQPAYRFSVWAFAICAHLACTCRRRMQPAQPPIDDRVDPSPLEQVSRREDGTNLWSLARTLSPSQYEVLWLRYGESMSVEEVAQVIRKSQVHVRVLLYRARVNMAKKLQAADGLQPEGRPRIEGCSPPVETGGV